MRIIHILALLIFPTVSILNAADSAKETKLPPRVNEILRIMSNESSELKQRAIRALEQEKAVAMKSNDLDAAMSIKQLIDGLLVSGTYQELSGPNFSITLDANGSCTHPTNVGTWTLKDDTITIDWKNGTAIYRFKIIGKIGGEADLFDEGKSAGKIRRTK